MYHLTDFQLSNFNAIYIFETHISLDTKYKFSLRSDNSKYVF